MALVATCSSGDPLRSKYDELLQLRETEPEGEVKRLAAALEEAHRSSSLVIDRLRAEVERHEASAREFAEGVEMADALQAENAALRAQLADSNPNAIVPSGRPAAADAARVEELEAKLAVYELLTGIKIESTDGEAQTVSCRCTAAADPSQAIDFELDFAPVDGEDGEIGYVPSAATTEIEALPDYLREEISCEPIPAPELRAVRWPATLTHRVHRAVDKAQGPGLLVKMISAVGCEL